MSEAADEPSEGDGAGPGLLVVVTGPSGVGKDTVVRGLMERFEDAQLSTSVTTRAARPREHDGREYHFVSEQAFRDMREAGALLEWARYAGNFYATPAEPVRRGLAEGRIVILNIEVRGALQVREAAPEALLVFLAPPDLEELERRLRERGTEDPAALRRRLEAARRELDRSELFDHVVVNDDLLTCLEELSGHIRDARMNLGHSAGHSRRS